MDRNIVTTTVCKNCGEVFERFSGSTKKTCKECDENRTKIIHCRGCNKEITIKHTSKKYLCDDCVEASQKNHFKNKFEQIILCPQCDCIVDTVTKKGSKTKSHRYGRMCDTCRDFYDSIRFIEICNRRIKPVIEDKIRLIKCTSCGKEEKEIVKNTYQAKDIRYIICKDCKNKKKQESYKKMSERMKKQNPMFNIEISKKAGETLKRKVKSGEILYKRGKEHHLYKGNTPFGHQVRSYLYKIWIYPILERDCFCCTKCGSNKNLQVHHLRPLRDICKAIFEKEG
jgi:hypothetical protein